MINNLIRTATCRVSCGEESGTGYLITDSNVLTARHCIIAAIESKNEIILIFRDQEGDLRIPANIFAQSEELDVCILVIERPLKRQPLPLNFELPREGSDWLSFGYPIGKIYIGHRVSGTISHLLDTPKLKIDIDLAVDPNIALQSYRGLSGAAAVIGNASIGMIRIKLDGTLGAISNYRMLQFIEENGIELPSLEIGEVDSTELMNNLAERSIFQESFEHLIAGSQGDYVFLEGAPGIGKTTFCNTFNPMDSSLINLGTYSLVLQRRGPGAVYNAQPEVFFDWLSTAVSSLITGKPPRKDERIYPILVQETIALIEAFSKYCISTHRHGVWFIDGLNEGIVADSNAMYKLIGLLPVSLPKNVTIVLTSPNYQNVAVPLDGRVKNHNILALPPLSDESSVAFCLQELSKQRATPTLVSQICEKAQGHPLYLRYLIQYANSSYEEDVLEDFPLLTGSIEQYYEELWTRLLEDAEAINLLAVMARLRWGIEMNDLPKILTPTEQTVFIPTVSRIRHLLLNSDTTTIYHPSFTNFLVSKTVSLETSVNKRLAGFCLKESNLEYCIMNLIFHLLRSDKEDRSQAVIACNQKWVDTCVELGIEPDILLFDIETALSAGMRLGPVVEVVRILLLSQRVSFRYNSLFAQSAWLIAEALISLKRPREALKHAIRYDTLIVAPDDALKIALSLIQHEYPDEALELLELLMQRIHESYLFEKIELEDFIHLCRLHLRTICFMRLAEGGGRMQQIISVLSYTAHAFKTILTNAPQELYEECRMRVHCVGTSYFLCFHNTYTELAQIMEETHKAELPPNFILSLIWTIFECENYFETYNLSKETASLSQLFKDIELLLMAGQSIEKKMMPWFLSSLIQLGAPSAVVQLVAQKSENITSKHLRIRSENGVDVDFSSIHSCRAELCTVAFLNSDYACPMFGAFSDSEWLYTLDQLIRALFWCEGMARRAKADGNVSMRLKSLELLKSRVIQPLAFTLAQRVKWKDSYAIPEKVIPFIYEQITQLLIDCYPNELLEFLEVLLNRSLDQCGLYSEGFRKLMFVVFQKLTIREMEPFLFDNSLKLIQRWKEHVILGIENRHELIPELLKLIPLFIKLGASEEAEEIYRFMLSVSMGPTWYKEDQLGLMLSILRKMPVSDNVHAVLPMVAGYLERASGEMTFQRFIQYEKQSLIGELFRQGRFASGCRYFKRQTCGNTEELFGESQRGFIDKPSLMKGIRFPGGALDEQHAILSMVQNSNGLDWRLCWSLLEIFQFGDERYLNEYAIEYAKIINQTGIDSDAVNDMVRRMEFVVGAEINPDERNQFLRSFFKELATSHYTAFSKIILQFSDGDILTEKVDPLSDAVAVESISDNGDSKEEDDFFLPGIFGRQSAMHEADVALASAEKQLKLRNLEAAKKQAVEVLRILQDGGWSIWGELSDTSRRAETILKVHAENAVDLVCAYAPLIETERHALLWRIAEHIISNVVNLISEDERDQLLKSVINHVSLMVGNAQNEISMFEFLETEPKCDSSVELFRLILWFVDHPQELRREKAAGMVAWLVEKEQIYFEQAVKQAFSMSMGYSADVLCGVLDEMSMREPIGIWNRIFMLLDLEKVIQNCKHVGRLIVLHRIAERAAYSGSNTGADVASRIVNQFRSGAIVLGSLGIKFDPPHWASSISREWEILNYIGVISDELLKLFEEEMVKICSPLNIPSCWCLENAVSESFRELPNKRLNRWEAKVRFALSTAILPFVSKVNFRDIEIALRIFNPSLPERTLNPGFNSPGAAVFNAISSGEDYSGAIGDSDNYFLNYHERIKHCVDDRFVYLEVLAVVIPTSNIGLDFFSKSVQKSFGSRELPDTTSMYSSCETCCHLIPDFAFFGSFTPAFPIPSFINLIGAKESDFFRINWRNGRSTDIRYWGQPLHTGCLLAIKRTAVHLPDGKKLAWILRVNGDTITMVDMQNNQLLLEE